MIIDFHTHIFPSKIAKKTIDFLAEKGGMSPATDGTAEGLSAELAASGVDIAVNLPVVTNPAQFDSVNRFAEEINKSFAETGRGIMSFAGIHPDCEDICGKMKEIKDKGFLGIKLHPDYQGVFIDDERYVKILTAAKEQDLIVITHSGVDVGYRGCPVGCTPERILRLTDKVPYSKFVLAHFGANEMFEEVLDRLCGMDIYFDTAFMLKDISRDLFVKIIEKHGEDKILFGSDCPWSDIERDINIIKSFNLPKITEEKIFCGNAKKLLGI